MVWKQSRKGDDIIVAASGAFWDLMSADLQMLFDDRAVVHPPASDMHGKLPLLVKHILGDALENDLLSTMRLRLLGIGVCCGEVMQVSEVEHAFDPSDRNEFEKEQRRRSPQKARPSSTGLPM